MTAAVDSRVDAGALPPADACLPAVVGADLRVPLVTGGDAPYANLDLAASAPALEDVAAHVARLLPYYSSVHRGAGYASQVSTGVLESARGEVGAFLGARPDDVVVFTRNTTDALNLLAGAVPGEVVCLDVEHHANLLPWRERRVVAGRASIAATLDALQAALRERPAALVAVTGASNVTGEVLPIARVAAIAHAAGARVVLDAAQLAPHRRVDIAALDVDYVAVSGHKLYAPYGAGALVGRRDWLDAAPPHLAGGGAVTEVRTDETRWAAAPHRHEGGTPNVLGAAALAQACRVLAPVLDGPGPDHERALLARLDGGLARVPGLRTLRVWTADGHETGNDQVAVRSFTIADRPAGYVAAYLSAEHGIGVRDGRFCAHPLLSRLCGPGGEALRVSIGIGTTAEHIDRLVDALATLITRGASWTYAPSGGRWAPTPDPRDLDPLGLGAPGVGTAHSGGPACR
jgi:selenocysteine lyase/cysteine desulfurase